MTEPVYFVYINSNKRQPHAQKWYGVMAASDDLKAKKLSAVLQKHQLDKKEYHLTLDELRAKYPYIPPKDIPA